MGRETIRIMAAPNPTAPNPIDPGTLADNSRLTHGDIDIALRRMKSGLAMIDLKRKLLAPDVDGCGVLRLSEEILALQDAA